MIPRARPEDPNAPHGSDAAHGDPEHSDATRVLLDDSDATRVLPDCGKK